MEKATEPIAAVHLGSSVVADEGQRGGWIWRVKLERPMRAVPVVVLDVNPKDLLEVASADEQQPAQALGADGADPALRVGVRVGRTHRCHQHLGALGAEHIVERPRELRITVTQHKAQLSALLAQHEEQVAGLRVTRT